jgi:uncharacterized protein (DUF1684 family)
MEDDFDEATWRAKLQSDRDKATDYYLNRFDWRGTPIPDGFQGPRYFPLDPRWRIEATLDTSAPGTGMPSQFATSKGDLRDALMYGVLRFSIDDAEHQLTAYRFESDPPNDDIFVPFKDSTSGNETYGGGRYLELLRHDGKTYILDFNEVYNPSCAYSPGWNCVRPPSQNNLDIRVEAGEMKPWE